MKHAHMHPPSATDPESNKRPVVAVHPAARDSGPVGVDDPVDGRGTGAGAHLAGQTDFLVSQLRHGRLTLDQRRICRAGGGGN